MPEQTNTTSNGTDYGSLLGQLVNAARLGQDIVNPSKPAKPANVAPPSNNVTLPQPAAKPNYPLYIGLGVGGVVLLVVLLKFAK